MLLQKQKNLHRPEEGIYGDCLRTCIACLLHVKRDMVTNFMTDREDISRIHERIDEELLEVFGAYRVGFIVPMDCGIQEALDMFGSFARGMPYMLTGMSRNGTNHVVLAQGTAIIWDPSLDGSGIVGPGESEDHGPFWGFEVICRPTGPMERTEA